MGAAITAAQFVQAEPDKCNTMGIPWAETKVPQSYEGIITTGQKLEC